MCFLQRIMQSGKGLGMQNLYDEVWKSYTTECGEVIRQGSDFDQKPDRETALSRDRSFKYTAGGAKPTQNLRFGQKGVGKLYDRVWGTYTTGGGGCGELIRQGMGNCGEVIRQVVGKLYDRWVKLDQKLNGELGLSLSSLTLEMFKVLCFHSL